MIIGQVFDAIVFAIVVPIMLGAVVLYVCAVALRGAYRWWR